MLQICKEALRRSFLGLTVRFANGAEPLAVELIIFVQRRINAREVKRSVAAVTAQEIPRTATGGAVIVVI